MGLCEDCDEIVAMEQFPDANTIKRAREIRASHKGAPLGWRPGRDNAEYLGTQPGFELLEGVFRPEPPTGLPEVWGQRRFSNQITQRYKRPNT